MARLFIDMNIYYECEYLFLLWMCISIFWMWILEDHSIYVQMNPEEQMQAQQKCNGKGKDVNDTDEVKVPAKWDDEKHYIWLQICLEEVRDGHKKSAILGAKGYENPIKTFEEQTNIRYTRT